MRPIFFKDEPLMSYFPLVCQKLSVAKTGLLPLKVHYMRNKKKMLKIASTAAKYLV